MNRHQPHRPAHRLETVSFTIGLGPHPELAVVDVVAEGRSSTCRHALWRETNIYNAFSADLLIEPADWIHHIALTALQDRPNSQERLLFGLTGGLGYQDPLF